MANGFYSRGSREECGNSPGEIKAKMKERGGAAPAPAPASKAVTGLTGTQEIDTLVHEIRLKGVQLGSCFFERQWQ